MSARKHGYFPADPKLRMLYVCDPVSGIPQIAYDGRHAQLLEDFVYVDRHGNEHRAEAGFVFDGGSVPRFAWDTVSGPFEYYLPAYIIHDWQRYQARKFQQTDPKKYQKLVEGVDDLFWDMLIDLDCPEVLADIMYVVVRAGAKTNAQIQETQPVAPGR